MNRFLKIKNGISTSEHEEKYVFITLTGVMALDAKKFCNYYNNDLLLYIVLHC